MIRINIIGLGFVDMAEGSQPSFKRDNQQFRFCDISLGRSVEFSIPATQRNRQLLGFTDDPSQYGAVMRTNAPCQVVYDGGAFTGTIAVTGYEGDSFKCSMLLGNATWIDELQSIKVADMVTSWNKGIYWDAISETLCDDPDLFVFPGGVGLKILPYENGISTSGWTFLPSINLKAFIKDLCDTRGIPNDIQLPRDYWLVASTLKGSGMETITISSTGTTNLTVSQVHQFFDVVDIDIEWATGWFFGLLVGGGTVQAKAIQPTENIELTFPNPFPTDCFLVQYSSSLADCRTIGGVTSLGIPDPHADQSIGALDGKTVQLKKGYKYFFAPKIWWGGTGSNMNIGYDDTFHPFSFTFNVVSNDDIAYSTPWYMQHNMPDMTFFELLKSAALSAGMELLVDDLGIRIKAGAYGNAFKVCDRVISVDSVTRRVEPWGNNTRDAEVAFDSEEYVEQPITWGYFIDSDQVTDKKTVKTKFSEGNVGTNGIAINDVEYDAGSNTYKLKAKKPTIAYADGTVPSLQRIPDADMVGYEDIGTDSTCVKIKMRRGEAEFFKLNPDDVWVWRGMAYVWTSADWANGVLTMTMQKVSQAQAQSVTPPPALVSIHASFNQGGAVVIGTDSLDDLKQYLTVTAYYDDSSSRVLADGEYTLSGTLAYPSATITVDCQGETDTFAVAVAYDAQVEYLQSSGTQYIDTGISPHQNIALEIKWKNTSNQNSKYLFGSGATNSDCIRAYIGSSSNWRFGGGSVSISTQDTTTRTATMNKIRITINGTNYNYSGSVGTFSSSTSIKIFASATGSLQISTRIYYFKVWDNETLVMDLITVRVGQTGYMYDRVSGTLFGNDGTGDFIVGADV